MVVLTGPRQSGKTSLLRRVFGARAALVSPEPPDVRAAAEGGPGGWPLYNHGVIARGIREFVGRDWQAVRDAKDAYWGDRIARLGPLEGLCIAEQLRLQALAQDPAWPRASDRREDLLAHVRLAELLRRAAPTRRA